jgi:Primase C terminal 2 (PriCT-2)/Bifunctional DNA primase/polymerase, N-terminal
MNTLSPPKEEAARQDRSFHTNNLTEFHHVSPNGSNGSAHAIHAPDLIRALTGPAVLLDVNKGAKAPREKNWQKITLQDMTPLYFSNLRSNIGVSLGAASNGLHSIDCDDETTFEQLLRSNPRLEDTLHSHGNRGGNIWIRIEGEAPKTAHFFREFRSKDTRLGEWRGTGGQTIIYGQHPCGVAYRHNGKPVITLNFSDIIWPDDWWLPWRDKSEALPRDDQTGAGNVDPLIVETMLQSIPPHPDYDTWLRVVSAVRNSLGSDAAAIEMLKRWSPEEVAGEYAEKLKSRLTEVNFGTLRHYAEANGYAGAVKKFFYNTRAFGMQGRGGYVPLTGESAVRQHLAKLGIPKQAHSSILCDIREQQFVDYIGPLAGHPPCVRTFNQSKMVITSGPRIVAAKEGGCEYLDNFFRELLHDPHNPDQLPVFLRWLAHCRRALLARQRVQTPALAFAGDRGDGKSLAIEIINRALGGRLAKGYGFFSGDKNFNSELAGAELIVMDDDSASKDHRARVRLAQAIKANQFAAGVRIEGKNRDAFNADPIQAVVIAVNCDPEELRVLPELTDSMQDKIILLKTKPAPCLDSPEENDAAINEALPAFLHRLERLDMSDAYDDRRRLKCFWHPEVIEALGLLSPERQLLELVHQLGSVISAIATHGEWSGTATELEGMLTDRDATMQHGAKRLLSWAGACGTYLGRLADSRNAGVVRGRKDPKTKIQTYTITAAPDEARGGGEPF